MRAIALFAGLTFTIAAGADACLNILDVDLQGKKTFADNELSFSKQNLLRHEEKSIWQERANKAAAAMKTHPATVPEMSDLAAILAHLGEYKTAEQILVAAENRQEGFASVASNLGTVYELLGDNERARTWIAIGMKRNPQDHSGTEWIHLKILDAKVELARDPGWLRTHHVLGPEYDHGTDPAPKPAQKSGNAFAEALGYQLQERLEFVQAPEPIVGELLWSLGDEVALRGAVGIALELYEFAALYKPGQAELLARRIEHARVLVKAANIKPPQRTL